MHFLYVMDPLETMHPTKDTTFAFMRAAQRRRHMNWHCLLQDLIVQPDGVFAIASQATVASEPPYATYGKRNKLRLADVDAVIVRKDPPFDAAYLHAMQMLELVRDITFVMNDPQGLRDAEEKLFALHFTDWIPPSCVTSDSALIMEYVHQWKEAVIKPIGRAGGVGVMKLSVGDPNNGSIIELLTDGGRKIVMLQQYLPQVVEGDKRVLLLDGDLLGAVLRVPQQGDLRANIHAGGSVVGCDLTETEKELVTAVGPHLRRSGLYFVGLDIIGNRLTEVNVTSPTCIQELGRLTGTCPENNVIEWLEEKVHAFAVDSDVQRARTNLTTEAATLAK